MKLYNRLIMNRKGPALDPLLRNSQNGFRHKGTMVALMVELRHQLNHAVS